MPNINYLEMTKLCDFKRDKMLFRSLNNAALSEKLPISAAPPRFVAPSGVKFLDKISGAAAARLVENFTASLQAVAQKCHCHPP